MNMRLKKCWSFFPVIIIAAMASEVRAEAPPVVYSIPNTRWEFRFPGLGYSSAEGVTISYPALAYFYKTNRAFGLEGANLEWRTAYKDTTVTWEGLQFQPSVDVRTAYFAATHQWEKPIGNQLRPYVKVGPALYRFHASDNFTSTTNGVTTGGQEVTKWSAGLLTEAGITLGWSRGFVLSLGYGLNAFYQPSLLGAIRNSIRGIHGARFALGYRW
jgi:opacity protein-like surface antigen